MKLEFDENVSKVSSYFQYKSIIEFYYDIAKGSFNLKRLKEYLEHVKNVSNKSKNKIIEIEIDRSSTVRKSDINKDLSLIHI